MDNKKVLQNTTDILTGQALIIKVDKIATSPIEKLLIKLGMVSKQRQYKLHPLLTGTMYRISRLAMTLPETLVFNDNANARRSMLEVAAEHTQTMCELISLAIQNDKNPLSVSLVEKIKWEFTPADMLSVCEIISKQIDIQSFMSSTVYAAGLNILPPKTDLE